MTLSARLQFGDASGVQSPVSFGGFGSLTRHLGRLSDGRVTVTYFSPPYFQFIMLIALGAFCWKIFMI